jgi:hypothetical protein
MFLFDLPQPPFKVPVMNPLRLGTFPTVAFIFTPAPGRWRRVACAILMLLLPLCGARAGDPDSDYIGIYIVIHDADQLNDGGKVSAAYAKYVEAYKELNAFQQANPNWNNQLVAYRLEYLTEKINTASAQPAQSTPAANAGSSRGNYQPAVKSTAAITSKSPVKLLDAGSEPRVVLRLHPTAGDKQTLSMTMKMSMGIAAGGKILPAMDLPAFVMNMTESVTDVAANGDASFNMAFDNVSVAADTNASPTVAAAMKASLAGMNGMTGTGKISNHGVNLGVEMQAPAGTPPQLSQAIEQMKQTFSSSSTPLPDDAVGPGAKWEYATHITTQGMTLNQSITFDLVSVDGDRVTLHSTISQSAANQKIQNPAMPGLNVDLVKLVGSGNGNTVLDLSHILPVSTTLTESTGMSMNMLIGQQTQSMTMNMDINLDLESK